MFFMLSFLRAHSGSGCSLQAAGWRVFFPSEFPQGSSAHHVVAAIADDCDSLHLLIMAGNNSISQNGMPIPVIHKPFYILQCKW